MRVFCFAVLFLLGCTSTAISPLPTTAMEGGGGFKDLYIQSTVTITSLYETIPARIRTSLCMQKLVGKYVAASHGSGVIVAKDGTGIFVLTAKHVVDEADMISIGGWGTTSFIATVVRIDPVEDLALLRIDANRASDLARVAPLGHKTPKVGTIVWCIGNSLGRGLVPSFGPLQSPPAKMGERMIARGGYNCVPGNSGGGIFYNGELIGIVSAILQNPRTGQLYVHMGYYVAIEQISIFLDEE